MSKFSELINGEKPVLVDFYATWCGPCKAMAPILEDLKSKVGDNASIIKIDVDKSQQAALSYKIQSVPTLMIFQKGQIKWRKSGVIPAKELEKVLNEFTVKI